MRPVVDPLFGATLRRIREQRGMSLRELARVVYATSSALHGYERGRRRPGLETAQHLDEALQANGELIAMVRSPSADLAPGAMDRLAYVARHPRRTDPGALDALTDLLAAQRRLEDSLGAAAVIDPVRVQLDMVAALAAEVRDELRPELVGLAAQWAQFAGWLHIARGRYSQADRWLAKSLEWATEVDDRELIGTVLAFRGHLAERRGELGAMIGLSRAAERDPSVHPGQRAYAAGQAARGLALAGEAPGVVLAELEVAADHAAHQDDRASPPWNYIHSPDFFLVQRGIVYRHLGEQDSRWTEQAITLLAQGLAGLGPEASTADWAGVYLCHLAAAHGQAGDTPAALAALDDARRTAVTNHDDALAARVDATVRTLCAPE